MGPIVDIQVARLQKLLDDRKAPKGRPTAEGGDKGNWIR
jgi:hypothetical protein